MSEHFTPEQCGFLDEVCDQLKTDVEEKLVRPVQQRLSLRPSELGELLQRIVDVRTRARDSEQRGKGMELSDGELAIVKLAIVQSRRRKAIRAEQRAGLTNHPTLKVELEQELDPYRGYIGSEWFLRVDAVLLPPLTRFLTLEAAIEASQVAPAERRIYDEKFHILQAPAQFVPDLAGYRAMCELRDCPVAVAFFDIDDFKSFNSTYGHSVVDKCMLPVFMSAIESHFFNRGFAYRYAGDEYAAIAPNVDDELATSVLKSLQARLARLRYPQIDGGPTVSIGYVVVNPRTCPFTDREIQDQSMKACAEAKEAGKNRIARFEPDDGRATVI